MEDHELLLLTWAQLYALELVMPTVEYREQKREIERRLIDQYQISAIQLVGRTVDDYAVGYIQNGDNHIVRFDTDDVESIYEL
ncbi:MAG: hypothetical protein JWN30_1971 [Bacilli bacterium]|nr:hypothetical protein [Bacilli bacterium]